MPRSVQWRRTSSDACCWHQTQSMDATIYILRQTGPTGFLLKEEGETKTVKVFLGDPHTCTCAVYKKERDLCKHICWLLLRKFRLSVNDPLSWQLGLVDMEVNEILRGRATADQSRPRRSNDNKKPMENVSDGRTVVEQREISDDDVCPICQDEFLNKKLPVTYCKFGCGNSVHIKCMKVWAEHQQKTSQEGTIKCPMCREDFGPIDLLRTEMKNAGCPPQAPPGIRMDRHIGMACGHCSKAPIEGKCYRCTVCPTFNLCQRCFNLPIHTQHTFQFRHKRNQRWRSAARTLGSSLPPALVNELQHRDISENDYDLLLQMERNDQAELSNITEDELNTIPIERVRDNSGLLAPGAQCRVCLRGFTVGQYVRKLPCRHKFHKDCIDSWLLHSHPNCPIDGIVVVTNTAGGNSNRSETEHERSRTGEDSQGAAEDNRLMLTALGIPMSSSRLRQTPGSRRPGPVQLFRGSAEVSRVVPSGEQLHLSGTRLDGSEGTIYSEVAPVPDTLPGRRLLNQASQLQERIARQLRNVGHESSGVGGDQALTPADLIEFLASGSSAFAGQGYDSRGNSAGSAISTVSESGINQRGRGSNLRARQAQQFLRRRSGSLDRSGVPSIQGVREGSRELYLGNNPQIQAATSEQPISSQLGSQPQRGRPRLAKPPSHRRPPLSAGSRNHRNFSLQGNALDANFDNE